jgi:hypothetical protein
MGRFWRALNAEDGAISSNKSPLKNIRDYLLHFTSSL